MAILLRETQETELLLIKRADREGDPWSGHMGFPGGRTDDTDESTLHTAIRETQEELGVDLASSATLIARLGDTPAFARGRPTDLVITPYLFHLRQAAEFQPNYEVAATVWAPLGPMYRDELRGTMPYNHDGKTLEMPCYQVDTNIVWGLTFHMLQELFATLREGETK